MASTVEEIKSRLTITEVVSGYLKLERAGSNFKARCPFHNERTPSFFVSPARGTYHCFGCNHGGDMFSFVQELEGLDFVGALKVLASRAGVEVKYEKAGERSEKEKIRKILEEATDFYVGQLEANPEARNYLKERGLTEKTVQDYQIGFAPDSWSNLIDYLKTRGHTVDLVQKAGLAVAGEKRPYDRFRSRIMFPLFDTSGQIVGFSGRIFGAGKSEETAKYVNTPQTILYDKSRVLYGFDRAKMEIKKFDTAVLVEGQMDVLMSHQAGVGNAVAVSGTALTGEHLKIINRLAANLIVAFDNDEAGIEALRRATQLATPMGLGVRVVPLGGSKDPADLARDNPKALKQAVEGAVDVIDFFIEFIQKKYPDKKELRLAGQREVLPWVALLPNKIAQAHYVEKLSNVLDLPSSPIYDELSKIGVSHAPADDQSTPAGTKTRRQIIEERLRNIEVNAQEAELFYGGPDKLEQEIKVFKEQLGQELLKEELGNLMVEIKSAEAAGDNVAVEQRLRRAQEILKKYEEKKEDKI